MAGEVCNAMGQCQCQPNCSEGHIVGHAGAHDLESEVEVDLLPGGHHTPSERFGREPSNFRAKRPNERWGLRVFDGMEKTLHVAQE
jgi:hypothetical protein